ncbi:tRNA (adenosine(37)-N6)-threonylcarbamoyltransferase complex ATPase subunit type 1 TsaE [Candidatus Uhrbacteria bacterium CG_4_9_14_0_2_um_filter_41_50]|uniref:tRNA threonylcarbamoyladenosine biosynthesis protein TsaE n=1 Tax=Candidatus Uhrbacteria bacterium CG_4_9_14_0_2_um_filter_41_50 TaxID=1975031 RepID=A0A2M8EQ74_9BACT|nr:MAG: tRNA (adenosine(37)-N6)-threonylcarbamoyltransferase complex ATPase subunit type 1 TsaE [Candidatus Uhrbacteria bacterium CG_4_10_14_3_um_filter_41_21]PIZ54493.1 MAG: tRNA (adenosine(37)-N6)-threonylcarbamoyltransferase complex ATPase subunit type 1 TsaE [Candidatus Uhrbacteria bacterium CG_4_10_14_0_2_um_filter_41_21]PJB84843.1 MAG: tRNA (adenosine(37)-N6)-threonylcarbamoyltransferase complex ATPase subunit type 1 TsaE [Candidatus Uhrbacteria bacterium CG_4_9_14_0_8_um_filter_41_16]PJC2
MTYETHSEKETHELAARFAATLRGGELIELVGDLGSGKTTFVRGVAEALGCKVKVKSPTFTVMNEYPVDNDKIKKIVHADFYRFEDPAHLEALALGDYSDDDTVIFVEWPDIFGEGILTPTHTINFEFVDEITRKIEL